MGLPEDFYSVAYWRSQLEKNKYASSSIFVVNNIEIILGQMVSADHKVKSIEALIEASSK